MKKLVLTAVFYSSLSLFALSGVVLGMQAEEDQFQRTAVKQQKRAAKKQRYKRNKAQKRLKAQKERARLLGGKKKPDANIQGLDQRTLTILGHLRHKTPIPFEVGSTDFTARGNFLFHKRIEDDVRRFGVALRASGKRNLVLDSEMYPALQTLQTRHFAEAIASAPALETVRFRNVWFETTLQLQEYAHHYLGLGGFMRTLAGNKTLKDVSLPWVDSEEQIHDFCTRFKTGNDLPFQVTFERTHTSGYYTVDPAMIEKDRERFMGTAKKLRAHFGEKVKFNVHPCLSFDNEGRVLWELPASLGNTWSCEPRPLKDDEKRG